MALNVTFYQLNLESFLFIYVIKRVPFSVPERRKHSLSPETYKATLKLGIYIQVNKYTIQVEQMQLNAIIILHVFTMHQSYNQPHLTKCLSMYRCHF